MACFFASLFPRIISSRFPGAIYVSQSLHFRSPVYVGDEISGEVQAINIKGNKKRYIAKFSTKCFKNGNLLVLDGEAVTILPTLDVEKVHSPDRVEEKVIYSGDDINKVICSAVDGLSSESLRDFADSQVSWLKLVE